MIDINDCHKIKPTQTKTTKTGIHKNHQPTNQPTVNIEFTMYSKIVSNPIYKVYGFKELMDGFISYETLLITSM